MIESPKSPNTTFLDWFYDSSSDDSSLIETIMGKLDRHNNKSSYTEHEMSSARPWEESATSMFIPLSDERYAETNVASPACKKMKQFDEKKRKKTRFWGSWRYLHARLTWIFDKEFTKEEDGESENVCDNFVIVNRTNERLIGKVESPSAKNSSFSTVVSSAKN